MTLARLVDTSRRVAETRGRRAKIALLAELLLTLPNPELEIGVAYLSGTVLQAKLGVGWATIQAALPGSAAEGPSVTLAEVDETLSRIVQATRTRVRGRAPAAAPRTAAAVDRAGAAFPRRAPGR